MDYFSIIALPCFAAQLAAHGVVAYFALSMWRRRPLNFCLLLGAAGVIGGVKTLLQSQWILSLWSSRSDASGYLMWGLSQFLSTTSAVLYAAGVVLMVRHLQTARWTPRPPEGK